MIHAKVDEDAFLETVAHSPVIAIQKLEYGYAVAAPLVAFYAPIDHPGGGNLPPEWRMLLEHAALKRMSNPHLRTLRPTAKPVPTAALLEYLCAAFNAPSVAPMSAYLRAAGDHPAVIDSECQAVIQAIEQHGRPDIADAMIPAKLDVMSDVIDTIIEHIEAVHELCEVGDHKPHAIRFHLLQASRALQTALSLLLKP